MARLDAADHREMQRDITMMKLLPFLDQNQHGHHQQQPRAPQLLLPEHVDADGAGEVALCDGGNHGHGSGPVGNLPTCPDADGGSPTQGAPP